MKRLFDRSGFGAEIIAVISLGVITAWLWTASAGLALDEQADADASPAPADGGVEGQVLIGPSCAGPVILGVDCPDRPYATTVDVMGEGGHAVTAVETDAEGRFRIPLAPGTYVLRSAPTDADRPAPTDADRPALIEADHRPAPTEQTATVLPGQFTTVILTLDNGIR